jgi:hypothetical protein
MIIRGERPELEENDTLRGSATSPGAPISVVLLTKECWDEDPKRRPSGFDEISQRLEKAALSLAAAAQGIDIETPVAPRAFRSEPVVSVAKKASKRTTMSQDIDIGIGTCSGYSKSVGGARVQNPMHDTLQMDNPMRMAAKGRGSPKTTTAPQKETAVSITKSPGEPEGNIAVVFD